MVQILRVGGESGMLCSFFSSLDRLWKSWRGNRVIWSWFVAILFLFSGCTASVLPEYIVEDKGLVPEGIDYSATYDAFFLSGIGRSSIIKIDRKTGKNEVFVAPRAHGFKPGAGLLVDDKRQKLYALGGYYMHADSLTSLYVFDLGSSALLKKYNLSGDHFLNDLTMGSNGTLYLTDTKGSAVYMLRPEGTMLDVLFQSDEIEYPNGIAISPNNKLLYVASFSKGVRILDLETLVVINQSDTSGAFQGIDGLEFYNNCLYAIQNGVPKNSDNFRKLRLSEDLREIIDAEVIETNGKRLDIPLTFCLAHKQAVAIANSNLQYLDQETFAFRSNDTVPHTKLIGIQL